MSYKMALVVIERGRKNYIRDRAFLRVDSLAEMKALKRTIKQKRPSLEIYEVNNHFATAPKTEKIIPGRLWCPYCVDYRRFLHSEDYHRCEICEMSTKDFYVVKYNPRIQTSMETIQRQIEKKERKGRKRRK